MTFQFTIVAALVAVGAASAPPTYGAYQPQYHQPAHHPIPAYGHAQPAYGHAPTAYKCPHKPEAPVCSQNTTNPWCLEDAEYPEYELKAALAYNKHKVLALYADVAELNTDNSVDRLTELAEETYLCPSEVAYVRPLRAQNTDGKWRVIVNNVKVDYDTLTQTTRVEQCLSSGDACPLVPHCYESSCLQKSVYHRFLVYDPCDQYFPFAIETFQLPAACACYLGAYEITH